MDGKEGFDLGEIEGGGGGAGLLKATIALAFAMLKRSMVKTERMFCML